MVVRPGAVVRVSKLPCLGLQEDRLPASLWLTPIATLNDYLNAQRLPLGSPKESLFPLRRVHLPALGLAFQ